MLPTTDKKDRLLFISVSVMLRFAIIPSSKSLHLVLQPVCPMLSKSDAPKKYVFANALVFTVLVLWAVMDD
jgi:hypothetical protein